MAVAKAAMASGVARKPITDWDAYEESLMDRIGRMTHLTRRLHDAAKLRLRKIVYAAGENVNVLKAAAEVVHQNLAIPVLLGTPAHIQKLAKDNEISLDGIEIVSPRSPEYKGKRLQYAEQYTKQNWRKGGVLNEALDRMFDANYYGMMMVQCGDADGLITGLYSNYHYLSQVARSTVGIEKGHNYFATMHLVVLKSGPLFLVDTLINQNLKADTLVDISVLAAEKVRCFGIKPHVALINFSDFGSDDADSSQEARKAVSILHRDYPYLSVDGEMQINTALNTKLRDQRYPDNKLQGKQVNILVFPRLSAANACYQLLKTLGNAEEVVGPIQIGLAKPVYFTDHDATVKEIVDITALVSIDSSACIL